jgi:acyl-CoA hydrolase
MLDSVHSGIVLVLVQDTCTVCAKHTVGSEIVLNTLDCTPR